MRRPKGMMVHTPVLNNPEEPLRACRQEASKSTVCVLRSCIGNRQARARYGEVHAAGHAGGCSKRFTAHPKLFEHPTSSRVQEGSSRSKYSKERGRVLGRGGMISTVRMVDRIHTQVLT